MSASFDVKKCNEFLLRNEFSKQPWTPSRFAEILNGQMNAGLDKPGGSSLGMLNSHVPLGCKMPVGVSVLTLDCGGTNARVSKVQFDANGIPNIVGINTYPMPGSNGEITKEEFFNTLAGHIGSLVHGVRSIGFGFSYPVEMNSDGDGIVQALTKEVCVNGLVGSFVGKGLVDILEKKVGERLPIFVLNDTVATLLAGMSISGKYSDFIGYILGTGLNAAYIDKELGNALINMELGGFDGVPLSNFDKTLDESSKNPGEHLLEKMVSGGYLGPLASHIFMAAVEEGLLSPYWREYLPKINLTTEILSEMVDDTSSVILRELNVIVNEADRETFEYLGNCVFERSAYLAAASMIALVLRSGNGQDSNCPVAITIDGSLYLKANGYKSLIEKYLHGYLNPPRFSRQILTAENATLMGTAVGGALKAS